MQIVLLLVVFILCLGSGMPIAFVIAIPATLIMLINGFELRVIPQMITGGLKSFTLMAVSKPLHRIYYINCNIVQAVGSSNTMKGFVSYEYKGQNCT